MFAWILYFPDNRGFVDLRQQPFSAPLSSSSPLHTTDGYVFQIPNFFALLRKKK